MFQKEAEEVDFGDVRGQENVKRAMEITGAGDHNVLGGRRMLHGIRAGLRSGSGSTPIPCVPGTFDMGW